MKKLLLFIALAFSIAGVAQKTWTGAVNESWSTAGNWSPNGVPTAADNVVIPTNSTVSLATAGSANSVSLQGTAVFNLSSSLTIAATSTFEAGTTVNWSAGSISGATVLNSAATMNITSNGNKSLLGAITVNNTGTFNITGVGDLYISDAILNNQASGEINLQNAAGYLSYSGGGSHVLNNSGTIRASSNGTPLIECELHNTGTLEVETGSISLSYNTIYLDGGVYNVSTDATMQWVNTVSISGTLTGTVNGLVVWANTVSVPTTATLNFTGSGSVSWNSGTLNGGGTLTNNSLMTLDSNNNKTINGLTTVNNTGEIRIIDAGDLYIADGMVSNQPTGTIDMRFDAGNLSYSGTGSHILNNYGTIRKSTSTGGVLIQADLHNEGTIAVTAGTLNFASAATTLEGGTYNISSGAYLVIGQTVTATGTMSGAISGELYWIGTLNIPSGESATMAMTTTGSGNINWGNGSLAGGGTLNLNTYLRSSSNNNKSIVDGSVLNNSAYLLMQGAGDIYIADGTLNNLASGIIDMRADAGNLSYSGTGLHALNNSGIIRRTTGTGTASIEADLVNTGTIEVTSGTLTLNSPNTTLTGGTYNVSAGAFLGWQNTVTANGTLNGNIAGEIAWNGNLAIPETQSATIAFATTGSGRVNWINGDLNGGGTLNNQTYLALSSNNNKVITGLTTLNNSALVSLDDLGDLYIADGVVNNLEAGTIDLRGLSTNLSYSGTGSRVLNNSGMIKRTNPSTAAVLIQCELHNTGTISVEAGELTFTYNNIYAEGGVYQIAEGAVLNWENQVVLSGELTGQNNGTFNWTGTINVPMAAVVSFSGSQPVHWQVGTLNGGGILSNNGIINFTTNNNKSISGLTTLRNDGTLNFTPSGMGDLYISDGTLENTASGVINLTNDQPSLSYSGVGSRVLNNFGLIKKSGSTGVSTIQCELNNSGVLEVETGTIAFDGSSPFANLETGIVTGSGTIQLPNVTAYTNDGTFSPIGNLNVTGNFKGSDASVIAIDIAAADSVETLTVSGTANLDGSVSVNLGFAPAIGNTFTVATSSNITACGLTAMMQSIFEGLLYNFSVSCVNNNSVVLELVSIEAAPPTADPQTFCAGATVADLVADGENLQWYANASGGTALAANTVLTTEDYFVSQTVDGFESVRVEVEVMVNMTAVPTAASPQNFESAATVADLSATGTMLQWYASNSGGSALPATTPLSEGTYYVSQTLNDCESARVAVVVTMTSDFFFYVDADGDGFGTGELVAVPADGPNDPPAGYSLNDTDCNDDDAMVWQSALLFIDNDGDGYDSGSETVCFGASIPEFYSETTLGTDCNDQAPELFMTYPFYADADGDGFGSAEEVLVCAENATTAPEGYSLVNTDCNDLDADVWEGTSYFIDNDGDGYDAGTDVVCAGETVPEGYSETTLGTDCDDTNAAVFTTFDFFVDADGDGFGSSATAAVCSADDSVAPEGYSLVGTDCDDTDASVYQSGEFYIDMDGDGYDIGMMTLCYGGSIPEGYSEETMGSDCDDENANVNPGMEEIPGNGIDDNCNGETDETDEIPLTQVTASQCGTTLGSIGTLINIDAVNGATAYRVRVVNNASGQTITQTVSAPVYNLMNLPQIAYGNTYSISVLVQHQNVWQPMYGPVCQVSTPASMATPGPSAIAPTQCGGTLSTITSLISTTSLNAAQGYRYRVTNLTDASAPNQVQILTRAQNFFSLQMLQSYAYGTTYMVEVATLVNGQYTQYGSACQISTPAVPGINNCGAAIATNTSAVTTQSMLKANQYRFELTDSVTNEILVITRPSAAFSFSNVTGFTPGKIYAVRVSVRTSDTWSPYGPSCNVTAPAAAREVYVAAQTEGSGFNAIAYPSPFSSSFAIELESAKSEKVGIRIFDMAGRQLLDKMFEPIELKQQQFGENLPAGVYNTIVTQGDQVKTLRVVKR